jgi:hypothetical protein
VHDAYVADIALLTQQSSLHSVSTLVVWSLCADAQQVLAVFPSHCHNLYHTHDKQYWQLGDSRPELAVRSPLTDFAPTLVTLHYSDVYCEVCSIYVHSVCFLQCAYMAALLLEYERLQLFYYEAPRQNLC